MLKPIAGKIVFGLRMSFLRNFPCPAWGRGTREWMKIPPRPPLAKGGWGGFESYFLTKQSRLRRDGLPLSRE